MILKLDKLPDRKAVKITFTAKPELKVALADYAEVYARTYGETETVSEIIPYILETFIAADTGFEQAREGLADTRSVSTTAQTQNTEADNVNNRQLHANIGGLRRHNPNVDHKRQSQDPFKRDQDK